MSLLFEISFCICSNSSCTFRNLLVNCCTTNSDSSISLAISDVLPVCSKIRNSASSLLPPLLPLLLKVLPRYPSTFCSKKSIKSLNIPPLLLLLLLLFAVAAALMTVEAVPCKKSENIFPKESPLVSLSYTSLSSVGGM